VDRKGRMMEWSDYSNFVQEMTRQSRSANYQDREENLKLLFDYSKEVFNEERNIFRDLEDKASKYLTVFTALLAAAGFFANWFGVRISSPKDLLEEPLLLNGVGLILIILITWLVVFLVLKIGDFEEWPLEESTIDFFLRNPIEKIYKDVSVELMKAMAKNGRARNAKARLLKWGHRLIILTWVLLLSFTSLFMLYKGKIGVADQKKCSSSHCETMVADGPNRLKVPEKLSVSQTGLARTNLVREGG
jgi:hypothetical protein